VVGTTGDDQALIGGALGDLLAGGRGQQVLRGLGSEDTLVGGAGADDFAFGYTGDSPAGTPDVIRDFALGEDRIDLSAIDADPAVPGDQDFAWRGTQGFTAGGVAEARLDPGGADGTMLLLDQDGNGAAEMAIRLPGVVALDEADVLL
jgi:serralysin